MVIYDMRAFSVTFPTSVAQQRGLAVNFKSQTKLRSIAPERIGIKPRALKGFVQKSVSAYDRDHVFSLTKQMCNLIFVIPKYLIIVTDGRNEKILGNIPSVYVVARKAGALDEDFSIFAGIH